MGFTEETDAITFRDLQERRELIRRRLEAQRARPAAGRSCGPSTGSSVPNATGSSRLHQVAPSRARRSDATKAAAPSGPSPSSSRRTRADPTTTPSATWHTAAACSGVDTPMPTQTGRSVAATNRPGHLAGRVGQFGLLAGHAHPADGVDESP